MKTFVISILILSIAFFNLIPANGQPVEDKQAQSTEKEEKSAKEKEYKKTAIANTTNDANTIVDAKTIADINATSDVNSVTDANVAADPNAVRAEIEKFEGLGSELKKLNLKSEEEIREWTRGRLDDRLKLALTMQEQIKMELKFLQQIAVEEKAAKTTAAIDGILLDRQERFKGVIEELEKNNRRLRRRAEREERRNKDHRERNNRERNR